MILRPPLIRVITMVSKEVLVLVKPRLRVNLLPIMGQVRRMALLVEWVRRVMRLEESVPVSPMVTVAVSVGTVGVAWLVVQKSTVLGHLWLDFCQVPEFLKGCVEEDFLGVHGNVWVFELGQEGFGIQFGFFVESSEDFVDDLVAGVFQIRGFEDFGFFQKAEQLLVVPLLEINIIF